MSNFINYLADVSSRIPIVNELVTKLSVTLFPSKVGCAGACNPICGVTYPTGPGSCAQPFCENGLYIRGDRHFVWTPQPGQDCSGTWWECVYCEWIIMGPCPPVEN